MRKDIKGEVRGHPWYRVLEETNVRAEVISEVVRELKIWGRRWDQVWHKVREALDEERH